MSLKQGEDLKISAVKKSLNLLYIPIYSMTVYRNLMILAGGGGNEIENKIMMFEVGSSEISSNILKKPIYEENTG
jgi:hypothetical protein